MVRLHSDALESNRITSHASICMPPPPCLPRLSHSTFPELPFTPLCCTCCSSFNWSWGSFSFQCKKQQKKQKNKQRCAERLQVLILNPECMWMWPLLKKHLFHHLLLSYTLFWSARYWPQLIVSLKLLQNGVIFIHLLNTERDIKPYLQ